MYLIDLDGTLIDTYYYHGEMVDRMVEELSKSSKVFDNCSKEEIRAKVLHFYKSGTDNKEENEEICKYNEIVTLDYYENNIRANKCAKELLEYLYEKGEKIVVVTGSSERHTELALRRLGMYEYVEKIMSMDIRIAKYSKREEVCYKYLAEMFNVSVTSITMIDNDPAYCKAAKEAGCKAIGVLTPHYPDYTPEMFEGNCDRLFNSVQEVYEAFVKGVA